MKLADSLKKPQIIVAILGKPNVGKSTLFNRLVGRRKAIVEDIPGVTRDRNYASCTYRDRTFTLVDTGGLDPTVSSGMVEQVRQQTEKAIEEADVLITMFDGREGLSALDEEIISVLRKVKKPITYAVNKIDAPGREALLSDFYRLGVSPILSVSAEQGIGVDEVMEEVLLAFPELPTEMESEENEPEQIPRIAVVGRPNVGKSTLINRLLGEERMITSSVPGTTRDAIDSEVTYQDKRYLFIDTAGIRRRGKIDRSIERYSISRAYTSIERSDIAVVILDAEEGIVEQDTKIIGRVIQEKKGCIILVNKWDLYSKDFEAREKIKTGLDRRLAFIKFAPVVFTSALKDFQPDKFFPLLDEVITSYKKRVSTGELNRVFEKALTLKSPPSDKGKTARLYYITQVSGAPPTFVIFANVPARVKDSYKRYLENYLREVFELLGTPLEIIYRQRRSKSTK